MYMRAAVSPANLYAYSMHLCKHHTCAQPFIYNSQISTKTNKIIIFKSMVRVQTNLPAKAVHDSASRQIDDAIALAVEFDDGT
jgi:hypothetical protein